MGGFASAALLTGNWWLGAGRRRRRGAVDAVRARLAAAAQGVVRQARAEEDRRRASKAELDAKFKLLPEPDAMRCLALREKQEQINKLAQENPAFTVDLLVGRAAEARRSGARRSSSCR